MNGVARIRRPSQYEPGKHDVGSKITLELDLSSYWHIGSGKGADAVADAVVLKDEAGLPVVPGRTLKGLLRDCMENVPLGALDET